MSGRDLDGKVVVVTGGSRGIGRAIVIGAARRGARVAFCARGLGDDAAATVAAARAAGGEGAVIAVEADVSREDDVDRLFDAAIGAWDRVDVAVHNAGINRDALMVHTSAEMFDDVIAVNLTGAFLVARRAAREMLGRGEGGRIVNVGSISQAGATSQIAYAASKGGLVGLTRALAEAYGGRGIAANLVVAGLVDTALSAKLAAPLREFMVARSPLRRAGAPDEVAAAVLWLSSGASSGVNGASLHASGGWVDVPW